MDLLTVLLMALGAGWMHKAAQQRRRVALLARFLARYQIERKMETVMHGYARALGSEPQRRTQIWELLRPTEEELSAQFAAFAADFARANPPDARVSKLPVWLPFATLWSGASFDMRDALALHARAIGRAVEESGSATAQERAFTISAELFLMQHTCQWFCRSRLVASARMLARHQTSYEQVLSVLPAKTRSAYRELVGR